MINFAVEHWILTTFWIVIIGLFVLAGYSDYLDRKYGERG